MGLSLLRGQWTGSFSPAALLGSPQSPGLAVRRETTEQRSFQGQDLYIIISATKSGEIMIKMPFSDEDHFTLQTTRGHIDIVIIYYFY